MKLTRLNDLIENGKALKGRWEVTPGHEVRYRAEGKEEEIVVRGSLVAAEPGSLVISVTERQSDQKVVTSLLKLTGSWSVNAENQIRFEVEKGSGKKDTLTLKGAWSVNGANEIIYSYQKAGLKTKNKTTHELAFTGHWDLSEKSRLTYLIGGDTDSALRFRGTFQSASILAKKGEIRYQIGVEMLGKRRTRTVALFGKWKVSRDLGLDFEMRHGDRRRVLVFGGEYHLDPSRRVTVNLRSEAGKPLGTEVILSRDIFGKDGQFFVSLQKTLEETSLESGAEFKW